MELEIAIACRSFRHVPDYKIEALFSEAVVRAHINIGRDQIAEPRVALMLRATYPVELQVDAGVVPQQVAVIDNARSSP